MRAPQAAALDGLFTSAAHAEPDARLRPACGRAPVWQPRVAHDGVNVLAWIDESVTLAPHAAQAPAVHACPAGHATPQPPQFAASREVSTHAPPQNVCPEPHTQALAEQVAPAGHALPQLPQFVTLVRRSTHAPPQLLKPAAQPQTPPVQL